MRLRLLILLAVPVLVVTGCGGSSRKTSPTASNGEAVKSASEIVADAKTAAYSATSVHIFGAGNDNGVPLVLNLHIVAGEGGKGRLSEKGLSFDLIRIGPTAYIKGSKAFYRQFGSPGAAQLLQGKWLKGSTTRGDLAALAPLTDLHKLLDQALAHPGTLAKTPTKIAHGVRAIGVKDASNGGILYVAAVGKPYPVEITKGGASKETLVFDQWNRRVLLTAPRNAVDISKLKG